ncbi:MAG: hypothetical protein HY962_14960 [Ignavibacteriae bacterium]|nr:hypothetical protein [Ignavibacteriota bacterium]
MASTYDMNDDMMLHALIEGELNDVEQQDVFRRLSRDVALQRRYRELVRLQSAMQEDARSLSVPPAYTAAVFSSLGLAIPEAVTHTASPAGVEIAAPAATVPGVQTAAAVWWTTGRLAGLLGLLGTAAVMVFLWRSPSVSPSAESNTAIPVQEAEQLPPVYTIPPVPDTAAGSSVTNTLRTEITATKSHVNHSRHMATQPRINGERSITLGAPSEDAATRELRITLPPAATVHTPAVMPPIRSDAGTPGLRADSSVHVDTVSKHTDDVSHNEGTFLRGMVLVLRYSAGTSSPAVTIGSKSSTALRDLAFAAGYAVSGKDRVGVELGREAFAQRFGVLETEGYARYQQNPLEYWLSAYYERAHVSLFSGLLTVFTKINAGAVNELGPMLRGSAGVRVPITGSVETYLAGEGVIVAYRHSNLWLTSKKYGPTAGLAVTF